MSGGSFSVLYCDTILCTLHSIKTGTGGHNILYCFVSAGGYSSCIEESQKVEKVELKGEVFNCSFLNIRSTPSGKVVGTYKVGDVVKILGKEESWFRTEKGYSHESYIKIV